MRYNTKMRLKPIIFFLVVGSLAGFFVYREVTRVGDVGVVNVGQQAPDFTVKGEDGRPIKLSDYRGKLVILSKPLAARWAASEAETARRAGAMG